MDLLELAARVEAAEGPDREIDAMIHFRIKEGVGCGGYSDAPAYTSSIDAAMTLVPEGWAWRIDNRPEGFSLPGGGPRPAIGLVYLDIGQSALVSASAPSLALTAAALRARAHQQEKA